MQGAQASLDAVAPGILAVRIHNPMKFSPAEVLTLASALLYALGALVVKRSADLGAGTLRTLLVSNGISLLAYLPLLALGGTWHPGLWWQPVIVGACFLAGQWLAFISLDRGDVSVATPVLGLKILLVAFFIGLLLGESLRPKLWAAAALATAGIALLNRRTATGRRPVGPTILTAGLAAAAFAVFDVLVQKWSPAWGLGRFLPLSIATGAALSLVLLPKLDSPLLAIPRHARPWLLGGTFLIAVQSVLFVSTLAHWGKAAPLNVIYSSRGLWSVLLVWLAGSWFRSREQELGRRILAWRLAGAVLMLSAITLVLG